MNKIGVFIKDTFLKITKSFSFISMLLSPIIVILIIVGISYFASQTFSGMSEVQLAVISEDQTIATILDESEESITIAEEIETEDAANEALADESIDGYLVAEWVGDQLNAAVTHNSSLDSHIPIIEQVLTGTQTLTRAQEYGVTPEQIQGLNEPVALENNIVSVEAGNVTEEDGLANAIEIGGAYFINIFIMMFIMFYAATVIEEIAGEKGTRMMEVILSSTTATTHFFGKLIGVFLVMVVHILFYVIAGMGAFIYFRDHEFVTNIIGDLDIGTIIVDFLEFASIFLVVGVLMFMFIAAFLGSLITKTEDINRAATPLSLVVVVGFYIGLFAMAQPENIVVVVSSFIPFLTPFVMPFRIATNTVSNLHVWLSIGGTVLFTIFVAFVSLMFYRANVLIYSDTSFLNILKQSWTLIRSENKATS